MPNQMTMPLTTYIERARKVLQHEQRTQHQDRAITSGGLEAFAARWYEETSTICKDAGLNVAPIHHFVEHLEGYRKQDPMQRASSLRAALAALNEIDGSNQQTTTATIQQHTATPVTEQALPPTTNGKYLPNRTAIEPIATPRQAVQPQSPARLQEERSESNHAIPSSTPETHNQPERKDRQSIQSMSNPIRLEAGMTQGHASLTLLTADVTAVPGVGPTAAKRLQVLGIRTIRELLFYFPREHRDYSKLTKISEIPFNEVVTTMGLVWDAKNQRTNNGRVRTIAEISDVTGKLYISWFNQSYLLKQLLGAKGEYIVVTGTKQRFGNKVEFSVRSHEFPERGDLLNTGRLVPIYPLTEGLSAKMLLRYTKYVVDRYAAMIPEHLPPTIRSAAHLQPLPEAVAQMHFPDNEEQREAAYRRLAFDELFLIQLGMQERRSRWEHEAPQGNAFSIYADRVFINPPTVEQEKQGDDSAANDDTTQPVSHPTPALTGTTLWSVLETDKPLEATLPFSFTDAQRRVICEIFADLALNKPMCRLLQGDVGAGKTAVAAAALFMGTLNGFQGAIMAPTEILAEQHARSISAMLAPFGIHTVLLTGSMRSRERAANRAALESGQAMIAIGTHALIQDDVVFQKLGLVIVDEQHRFGVEQRDALRQKGYHPHMLVMTATPIPRTLALTLYGDLDVSVIDQLPPGRQKIISRWRTGARRGEAYTTIKEQVTQGHQAFIICPLIEESETLQAKAVVSEYERLQREVFPTLHLGLLHGAMKSADKDQVMHSFRDHELDILIATSVIEVGIDVPNATVMVIEDANRFGLSQLHQFRGRVGRGKHQSYCYVLSEDASIQSQDRLGVFQETTDGFRLAEEDLRLRGPGDFIGVRQSGMPEMKVANLSDTPLIELARKMAAQLWENDPYLRKLEHKALKEKMFFFWQSFMAH
jgi:ATP-dependent DNA helicase RecG